MICDRCEQRIKMGQERLTKHEKRQYSWSGRPTESPNIIEAQCVKAAAIHFGIDDWMAYWDPELTIDENIQIMAKNGSQGPTARELSKGRFNHGTR